MGDGTTARCTAAALLALLLFGFPFLAVFDVPSRVLGVPVLWAYLFAAWGLVIALGARLSRGS